MAQLKSTVVQGSLRATDSIYTNELWTKIIQAPTDSNGTAYGVGTNGQVLKSNGTHVYWAAESGSVTGVKGNSESSYRTGQVNITAANVGAAPAAGANTIATVGTITSGTWNGTTIDIAHGGTGKTTAAEAWTNLGGGASGKHDDSYFAKASHNHAGYVEAKSYAITIPASVTSYAFTDSSSWITADCACIATDLQAKDPKAIITWSFTNDHKINFTLSAAGTISFNMWVAKIIT